MEKEFFPLTIEEAKKIEYDLIIVGAGFGGGVLAANLFDSAKKKKILVIDKGHLIFTSHCLNAARSGGTGDSGQQNDDFFKTFKSQYLTHDSPNWVGGPMYTLGGRSTAWGLFIPRPHSSTLAGDFPMAVANDLKNTYYKKAEYLMKLGYPETRLVHQNFIDRLNDVEGASVHWKWGRIAAEFKGDSNFAFARGAYSTVDKLLQIAMASRQVESTFKILLNAEVRSLKFGKNRDIASVMVRLGDGGPGGPEHEIKAKKVVLCAGSVHSPAILLRSVDLKDHLHPTDHLHLTDHLHQTDHLHLTDHAMYLVKHFFKYGQPERGKDIGSMKLQTFVKLPTSDPQKQRVVLANFTVDASAFLSRSEANTAPDYVVSSNVTTDHSASLSTHATFVAVDASESSSVNSPTDTAYPHIFTMVFTLSSKLGSGNKIVLTGKGKDREPIITIKRTDVADDQMLGAMDAMVAGVIKTMTTELGAVFDPKPTQTTEQQLKEPLGLGNVAHEVGSLPMEVDSARKGAVDGDLKLLGCAGVYICDLSVFPISPAANPSLTLAALALRLSDHLVSLA